MLFQGQRLQQIEQQLPHLVKRVLVDGAREAEHALEDVSVQVCQVLIALLLLLLLVASVGRVAGHLGEELEQAYRALYTRLQLACLELLVERRFFLAILLDNSRLFLDLKGTILGF